MRGRRERLGCGDADVTIWGGVNGVGSEAIEEQSGRGVERGKTETEGSGFGMHTVDTATHKWGILSWRHTTTTFSLLLVLDSSNT